MPAKARGPAKNPREIDRFEGGTGWIAHPDELMQRASHALQGDDGVWVVDPVDFDGLDARLSDYGPVAGVVVLFNWHARDASSVATRHDVPVSVPKWVNRVARRIDAPIDRFEGELADTGFRARRITPNPLWREAALYRERDGTLLIPESLGTASYFLAPGERLGVSLYQRLWPPRRALGALSPDRILVGHGEGIFEDAPATLADALAGARRRAPAAATRNGWRQLRALAAGIRD